MHPLFSAAMFTLVTTIDHLPPELTNLMAFKATVRRVSLTKFFKCSIKIFVFLSGSTHPNPGR
jgi:hypothetical protein